MRPYILLILIAVTMAFSAGYLSLSLREAPADTTSVTTTVSDIRDEFLQSRAPDRIQLVNRRWLRREEKRLAAVTQPEDNPRTLDAHVLKSLAHHPDMVMGERAALFRLPGHARGNPGEKYGVFDIKEWERFIESKPFVAAAFHEGDVCVLRQGDVCWRNNLSYLNRMAQKPAGLLMIGSLILAFLAVRLLFKKIDFQNRAEERKRFALQSLTHELRTPLSSLVVSLETLRNHFNAMTEDAQDATMRICDDVQRLQRLAEASKQYLTSHDGKNLILFQPRQIPSVRDYVEGLLEPFMDRITLELPAVNCAISLDPYWVGLCAKNLVENALLHGRSPVRVAAAVRGRMLELSVEDQGVCTFTTLIKMSKPFVKGRSSQGLGLGLAIVRKVIQEMNGTLDFEPKPTRFIMRLEEQT